MIGTIAGILMAKHHLKAIPQELAGAFLGGQSGGGLGSRVVKIAASILIVAAHELAGRGRRAVDARTERVLEVGHGPPEELWLRGGDGSANPYLAIAAALGDDLAAVQRIGAVAQKLNDVGD